MGCGIFAAIEAVGDFKRSGTRAVSAAELDGKTERQQAAARRYAPFLARLDHRGPDASGLVSGRVGDFDVHLGMTRLKVVDQSDLAVPFHFRRLGVTLAFNGEIYNWRELRQELTVVSVQAPQQDDVLGAALDVSPARGWETECDAEVVAAAWRRWGPDCLHRFNGMWAFVLVDHVNDTVFIARDRAGIKPLYYAKRGGSHLGARIYVASEPKAFPFDLEPRGECPDVAALEFDFRRHTPFEGVEALEPGSYLLLRSMDDWRMCLQTRWWTLPDPSPEGYKLGDGVLDHLTELVVDAIRIRHAAEVPVGLMLSGGLDSAIIQAVCQSDRLYTVTFPDDGVDNVPAARLAAGGRDVVPVTFTRDDLIAVLPEVAYHLDTPGTWTAVNHWFLNKRIARDNVIVLAGDGADELFLGYSRYRILNWLDALYADGHLEVYGELLRKTLGPRDAVLIRMLNRGDNWWENHCKQLIDAYGGKAGTLAERMARTDFYTTMQVNLRMADRMASAFSLENRTPFLDYRIMELAARLPVQYKLSPAAESKLILRQVAERLGVPEDIVHERSKKGFSVPRSWSPGDTWDRSWFAELMESTWRKRFFGGQS